MTSTQMRRRSIRQFLIGSIAIFALLADVGIAGLWVRSYFAAYGLSWYSSDGKHIRSATLSDGLIYGDIWRLGRGNSYQSQNHIEFSRLGPHSVGRPIYGAADWKLDYRQYGFGVLFHNDENATRQIAYLFPCWFLCLLTSAIAAFFGRKFWRNKKLARVMGLCHHCGYDLRASPERCPECGNSVVAAATHKSL